MKFINYTLLAAVIALTLSACGGEQTNEANTASPEPAATEAAGTPESGENTAASPEEKEGLPESDLKPDAVSAGEPVDVESWLAAWPEGAGTA